MFQKPQNRFELSLVVLNEFFNQQTRQQMRSTRVQMWIDLQEVAKGSTRILNFNTQAGAFPIEINIPKGVHHGEAIRYPRLAPGGMDMVVEFHVYGHPVWQRDGLDLLCEKELDFWELILGTVINITTVQGPQLSLKVPPKTNPGAMLRMKGQGLERDKHNRGDVLVKIKSVMPTYIPNEILDILKREQNK